MTIDEILVSLVRNGLTRVKRARKKSALNAHFAPEPLRAAAARCAGFSSAMPPDETPETTQGLENLTPRGARGLRLKILPAAVHGNSKSIGKKVAVVGNYDEFRIDKRVVDYYAEMVRCPVERYCTPPR
ncbi:MAG: hypothetical protein ABWY07_11245 [Burkholderiales bacterium]